MDAIGPITVAQSLSDILKGCRRAGKPHMSLASFVPTIILRCHTKVTRPRAGPMNNTKAYSFFTGGYI